jgi:DNA-binding NarL/FixJ family response regulator
MNATLEPIVSTSNGTNPSVLETAAVAPKVRVWLVDDNDKLRSLVGEILGHEVDIECARQFSSPDQLLSTLASRPGPDVILLDVQMGDRNGLDAVRPIKSLTPATRVLMFTTCFNPEWRERAFREGASDYLLKTYGMEKVVARIRCPANDADPKLYPRRRVKRGTAKIQACEPAGRVSDKSARLFSRTFEMLRALWN